MIRFVFILMISAVLLLPGCKSTKKESAQQADSTAKVAPPHEPKAAEVTPGGYMVPFFDGSKWGYMDNRAKVAVPATFDAARYYSEGLAAIRIGLNWGFIDTTGKVVIEPKYNRAGDFKSGRSRIRLFDGGPRGFIDRKGSVVIAPDSARTLKDFSEGLCPAIIDKRYGYIDTMGSLVIPNQFLFAGKFGGGRAPVQREDSSYGVIDRSGKPVLPKSYVYIDTYAEGLARARVKDSAGKINWCFVNPSGAVAFTAAYDEVRNFAESRAAFRVGQMWGFLDKQGKQIMPPQFDFAMDFSEGLAAVRQHRGWGYIDPSGGTVIPSQFNQGEPFKHGIAAVTWPGGKMGYVNVKGESIWTIIGIGTEYVRQDVD